MQDAKKLMKIFIGFHESDKSRIWDKGNDVLYSLCRKHPEHKDVGWILAKVWLIGRSYAAAIERTKHKKEPSDIFCIKAAKKIKMRGRRFDEIIGGIPKTNKLTEDNIKIICKAHSDLTDEFCKITGQHNKSLASKYLHFHRRIVPLCDARAKKAIGEIFRKYGFLKEHLHNLRVKSRKLNKDDRDYFIFATKIFYFQRIISENSHESYTVRDIDKYLVGMQEKGVRNKT